MRIFVSSVRRGLAEERDALPGLVSAIGHAPVRFEDFSSQTVPSREACLTGIASAEVYLLILGPHYGYRFPDTGQSPTHDEWMAAVAAGMPRLVYRKEGVRLDADQEEFVRTVGDYTSGVFYDTFSTTHELLTKVAGKIRELEQAGDRLRFMPLIEPVRVTWWSDFDERVRGGHAETALEVHVVPAPPINRPARVMSDLAQALPGLVRESGLVDASLPLDTTRRGGAIIVTLPAQSTPRSEDRLPRLLGVRLGVDGQASAWASLPGDSMGYILDASELPRQIGELLRLLGGLRVVESEHVAIAVGVSSSLMLSTGQVSQLPRQFATMLSMSERPVRVEPDELVSMAALDTGAIEVGQVMGRMLLEAVVAPR